MKIAVCSSKGSAWKIFISVNAAIDNDFCTVTNVANEASMSTTTHRRQQAYSLYTEKAFPQEFAKKTSLTTSTQKQSAIGT